MLFNTYPFLVVFLPAAMLASRLVDPYPQARIGVLVLFSFVFYAYGNPPFILLLVASIAVNWLAALAYGQFKRGSILTAAIVLDLLVLGVFKYANFFAYNLGLILQRPMPELEIALPLGISFFTFHHIMYLADLKRGKPPFYPLDRYALYIAFFPQAIAGPLVRWSEVMHQFGRKVYEGNWQREFTIGFAFILTGLFEKILLADRIAHLIDPVYARAADGALTSGEAWMALGFNFQILYDFAGYSDIAIGLGLLFGVKLPFNFNAPFRSTSIQDFWQRWHMTLMTFLRDYCFFPLVNARILPRRFLPLQMSGATLVTMTLCGLWHGPSWTFVLWGTVHGIALVVCTQWRRHAPRMPALLGWALTVIFVLPTGVLFRAVTLEAAMNIFRGLFAVPSFAEGTHLWPLVVVPLMAFLLPASQDIIAAAMRKPRPWLAALIGLGLLVILIDMGERNTHGFAYYKF
jgi:D-alanyl-lipoteichoic acid acyltransferase DltB (MBOAT superfamily)